jgi:hypothetical protein
LRIVLPEDLEGKQLSMENVPVFGNAGARKSTLAKRLAAITGLPLYLLDTIQFRAGRYQPHEDDGGKVSPEWTCGFQNLGPQSFSKGLWSAESSHLSGPTKS